MTVFRVEKNANYTVMSNEHLRNKELSLKAKGLLSQMLSLPEEWDYSLEGLACINREGVDAIRTGIQELERFGYLERRRLRDSNGRLGSTEYIVREHAVPKSQNAPGREEPALDSPMQAKPMQDFPAQGNPRQSSKDESNKERSNTYRPKQRTKRKKPCDKYACAAGEAL
jgi:hypothetical protein